MIYIRAYHANLAGYHCSDRSRPGYRRSTLPAPYLPPDLQRYVNRSLCAPGLFDLTFSRKWSRDLLLPPGTSSHH